MTKGTMISGIYEICEPLGSGGIGEVYKAWHIHLRKYVVVKKLKTHVLAQNSAMNIRAEVDILKNLHHRYLPQVYDFVQIGTDIYSVMDYIDGYDLKKYMDAGYVFEEKQLILWLEQLCEVLEYMHSHKPSVIHCDIKPANIMVTQKGDICLIDFNISLEGEDNQGLAGASGRYAPPEQLLKAEAILKGLDHHRLRVDARSDIYSLGAVFYELMSGLSPVERRDHQICLKNMELPYSSSLVNIIDRSMMRIPSRRFKSAGQMGAALRHMETWSRSWRRLTLFGRLADAAMLVLTVVLMCCMIHGYGTMQTDRFFQAYETFIASAQVLQEPFQEEPAVQAVLLSGERFLNTSSYAKALGKYPQERSNILYCMGQACDVLESYGQAQAYLTEAAQYNPDNAEIYRDLAVVQAKDGQLEAAEDSLELACRLGLAGEDAALIKGQLSYIKGDYETAYTKALEAAESTQGDILNRAAVIVVLSAQKLENYQDCVAFTRRMVSNTRGAQSALWLQKSGELCAAALDSQPEDNSKDADLVHIGIDSYEQLMGRGYAGLEDMFNLLFLYEYDDQLEKGKELLMQMKKMYPDQYKIYVQMSYICYLMENRKPLKERDYAQVLEHYKEAEAQCDLAGVDAQQDADMMKMKAIVTALEEKGWAPSK